MADLDGKEELRNLKDLDGRGHLSLGGRGHLNLDGRVHPSPEEVEGEAAPSLDGRVPHNLQTDGILPLPLLLAT